MDLPQKSQFIIYQSQDGKIKLDVRFEAESVWLTQAMIVELFQSSKSNISEHIKNIFAEGELNENSVVRFFRTTATDGKQYSVKYYNLDVIISVGYRVQTKLATQFRIWATQRLSEFIRKGFVLDDERLSNPDQPFDYFEELLERIQKIRTSEKRFYQKITDIYATSVDYDPTSDLSLQFFATVQNKMHWAITGKTDAEIIAERANHQLPNMGLTTFRGNAVRKSDIGIAKNYLSTEEISALNNLTEQYLIFAQGQAMQRIPMYMKDWVKKLDAFISINGREILKDAGTISSDLALSKAEKEYELFDKTRVEFLSETPSDFDNFVAKTQAKIVKAKRGNARGKGKKDAK